MMGGITAGDISVIIALVAMLALHFFRGPNRQYDDLAERIAATDRRLSDLELKVAAEHPVFLERLAQLGVALTHNTTALERLGTEFHAFARNFRGPTA